MIKIKGTAECYKLQSKKYEKPNFYSGQLYLLELRTKESRIAMHNIKIQSNFNLFCSDINIICHSVINALK